MGLQDDLDVIAKQEKALQFESFGADTAWEVGCSLREQAMRRAAVMTFEIQVAGRVLFHAVTHNPPAGQADWIRRKRNTVMRFGRASYAMGLQLELEKKTIEERHGLTLADYALHGGGFPIVLRGTGYVGSVVASGLTQREDHAMVVTALGEALGTAVVGLG
ncbi:heme-degrading domain-containing protein [Granulicella tundricola]|uniref:UPF0303 protein AciX9_2223 n=1 Tax=Granulicella tundricola (strain ATCC BAA-1859 / DSM 23138 / MP5ACTX9) TaxID=1198114 RepID=E8X341_GRATM|nr:heme-degrading domain-containing protein [Granulicella tundricola]ADW69265.1 protein of unknown function DUF336 [Granulicella tundricola MP5ACTX9]